MDRLADFIDSARGLVTVLSVCWADPALHDNRGCEDLWKKAGSHRTECAILAADPTAFVLVSGGDRLRCDVTAMEVTLAQRLMTERY